MADEYVRHAKHKQQEPKSKQKILKQEDLEPPESERGTNINNEDLLHVVQQDSMNHKRNLINPSPLLSSQNFKSQKMSLDQLPSPDNMKFLQASTEGAQLSLLNSPTLRLDLVDLPETSPGLTQ